MRIPLVRFLGLSRVALRLLCAPVARGDACLITLREPHQILTPVIASDGRTYDACALQTWLRETAHFGYPHVIPGCPIDSVDATLWPEAACQWVVAGARTVVRGGILTVGRVQRAAGLVHRAIEKRRRVSKVEKAAPMWQQVLRFHRDRPKFRGAIRFRHAATSAFEPVHRPPRAA